MKLQGHPNLCAYYVRWKPNQMAVCVDLQAELTIVSTSQTKHLIPCFQYEFDIQQHSVNQWLYAHSKKRYCYDI